MNNRLSFIIIFAYMAFAISGCFKSFYVVAEPHQYNNGVVFTIEKIQDLLNGQAANRYYVTDKSFKTVEVWVSVSNTSSETKEIDFQNFYLLDTKSGAHYKIYQSEGEGLGATIGRLKPTIPKGVTKHRKLVFAYPKDEKPEEIEVSGIKYTLHYTNTPPQATVAPNTEDQ